MNVGWKPQIACAPDLAAASGPDAPVKRRL